MFNEKVAYEDRISVISKYLTGWVSDIFQSVIIKSRINCNETGQHWIKAKYLARRFDS